MIVRARAVRAFIAIEVPALREQVPWPRAPERHLTLRFLGEIPESRLGPIEGAMRAAAGRSSPFELDFRRGGAFPDLARPRVAWVGVDRGGEALRRLERSLGEELTAEGIPAEPRPFAPHVTVLRVRNERDALRARAFLAEVGDGLLGTTTVDRLVLFESRLAPGGAQHVRRAEAALNGPGSSAVPAQAP